MVTPHGTGIAILVEYRRIWQEVYPNRQTPEGSACYVYTCLIVEAGRNFTASPAAPTGGAIKICHCRYVSFFVLAEGDLTVALCEKAGTTMLVRL